MKTRFESKSNRVKGLAFHSTRPYILASLHNGVVQLWDYRMGTLLDRFDEHDGPVRGVDFHAVQPLIASGGDDYRIKIWDYKLRRCLFTLLGHLDYIRTVNFHREYPWLVSASDDQTIRIWNWQSRSCVSVLTGHNHYVMCASFHPKDDLIVSASLDQTVRVWDISGLRKKYVRGAPTAPSLGRGPSDDVVSRVNADLFGGNDAVVKYVLEGHDRGANWASFHPTLPLVISGADDRQVKLWRMNETKAWEVDTMRGHTNNVSCVLFHPRHELIISNSEDRSIRVWDISKRMGVQTFRRENDRFWILAAHPEQNLLAAGHDSGMIVFKLERERPAYASHGGKLFYCKDRYLRLHEFGNSRDVPVVSLRRAGHSHTNGLGQGPRSLQYNPFNTAENNVLVFSDTDGGAYELMTFGADASIDSGNHDVKRGSGLAAVFIARNRFAVLDKDRQILIKNMQNEVTKKTAPPSPSTDGMFFAGTSGRILLRSEDRITLFEQQSRRVLSEVQVPRVKYCVWNRDCSYVALLAKHGIVIANRNLEQLCSVSETVRVKSGAWDYTHRIFVYTTSNHIKYCLPNGDTGIIRTLDVPVYITKAHNKQLFCLDRECKTRIIQIDNTEALFKLALEDKNYPEVMRMVRHSRLCGQAIIAYLQAKGFPEVALHFVDDMKTRFKLALACGNIEVALLTASELNDDECWHQLGVEALRQGNHQVVEMAYQRTKNFERLSFLYLLTGNTDKLRKMLKIAEMRQDIMARYHNSLYLGDAEERFKVLQDAGQLSLAYLTAATHGLTECAEKVREVMEQAGMAVPEVPAEAMLLQPPTPIVRADNWPLLTVPKTALQGSLSAADEASSGYADAQTYDGDDTPAGDAWDDDLDFDDGDGGAKAAAAGGGGGGGGGGDDEGGGWDDDLDLDDLDDGTAAAPSASDGGAGGGGGGSGGDFFAAPTAGTPAASSWVANSSHAADHSAAGSYETAMQLLNRQVAVVAFEPLKPHFTAIFAGAAASVPGLPLAPSMKSPLQRNAHERNPEGGGLPSVALKMKNLIERLKLAYKAFSKGSFPEAKEQFDYILCAIPLVVAESRAESSEIKDLVGVCREYLTAIRLKTAIADEKAPTRQTELAAYFTHCALQPSHLVLALRMAMVYSFKLKNFITAAGFARRLLELPDVASEKNADVRSKAQKVLQKSEQMARNEHQLEYDERNPFTIDCGSLTAIYRGSPIVRCSYCASGFGPEMKGKLCTTCGIAAVGVETLGLVTMVAARR